MDLLIVVVLYNCEFNNSQTLNTLLSGEAVKNNIKLIIYDNSFNPQRINFKSEIPFEYFHDPRNKGLATAYNYALRDSFLNNAEWLLLLDQDSSLPSDYLKCLLKRIRKFSFDESVTAIVPRIFQKTTPISPAKTFYGGIMRPIKIPHERIFNSKIFAIGSCSTLRVSFLKSINGFNEKFWLDGLDRWLYNTIELHGKSVYVFNSVVQHQLSIIDFDSLKNPNRYSNIMEYETIFMGSYKSKFENYIYYLRLINRGIYLWIFTKDKIYSKLTFKHLLELILKNHS
jgi:GT2 family glycosyltransferase